jgi:hypothetical protein
MSSAALLQAILDNPRYHDYLAILKGARNGLVYGFKVRFPHALIMAILFGRGEYVFPIHNTPATDTSSLPPPTMRGQLTDSLLFHFLSPFPAVAVSSHTSLVAQ